MSDFESLFPESGPFAIVEIAPHCGRFTFTTPTELIGFDSPNHYKDSFSVDDLCHFPPQLLVIA